MMRILVNADVFLDLLLDENFLAESASKLWQIIESEKIEGYVTITTLNEIFEIGRETCGTKVAWQAISDIKAIMKVCPINDSILNKASWFYLDNFEAALQLACATAMKMDAIITNNVKNFNWFFTRDFQGAENNLSVLPPDEFLTIYFSVNQFENSGNQLEKIVLLIRDGNKRLDVVNRIIKNSHSIVFKSTDKLLREQTQFTNVGGILSDSCQISTCLRDMEIILKYVTYAMLASDFSVLDDRCINGLRETYQLLSVPCDYVAMAVHNMKEVTIAIANDPIGITPGDCSNLISELATYFDLVIAGLS